MNSLVRICLLFLTGVLLLPSILADTAGVWHQAEDIRGGVFGDDEQKPGMQYTFINPVIVKEPFTLTNLASCSGKLITDMSGTLQCGQDLVNDSDADPTNELQGLPSVLSRNNNANGNRISGVDDPIFNQDAATKSYVDSKTDIVYRSDSCYCDSNGNGNAGCDSCTDTSSNEGSIGTLTVYCPSGYQAIGGSAWASGTDEDASEWIQNDRVTCRGKAWQATDDVHTYCKAVCLRQ